MTEVSVEDVIVRLLEPDDDGTPRLANERVRIVLLREHDGNRVLPIWIGPSEGDALALQLGSESMPRPLTVDLMARLVEASGARIERVTISALRGKTFYAVVTLGAADGGRVEVDARPSDALNLAVRVGAPISVDDELMDQAGVRDDDLASELAAENDVTGQDAQPGGEWSSLSPEIVRALHPTWGRK